MRGNTRVISSEAAADRMSDRSAVIAHVPFALKATALSALLASIGGCRSTETLKQECAAGDVPACETACERGVIGDGWVLRRRACSSERMARSSRSLRARAGLASSSTCACKGGHGESCLYGAQMVEAPYLVDPTSGPPSVIPDADLRERERLVVRACELGSKSGCQRLGDIMTGKNPERAKGAYVKACGLGAQPKECTAARQREVAAFDVYRQGCKRFVADDCARLGDLVYRLDMPRAIRLFQAEAELRGIAALVGGQERFIALRAREARSAATPDPTAKSEAPAGAVPTDVDVRVSVRAVHGRVARPGIERALGQTEQDLRRCGAAQPSGAGRSARRAATANEAGAPRGALRAELIVDRTGDVWRTTVTPEGAGAALAACVERTLSKLRLQPPVAGTARIEVEIAFEEKKP